MTTPTNRDDLVKMLARRMMAYDQCSEDKLAVVYEGRAEDVLSALDGAGIALAPREGCAAIWGAGNHVRYVTHGETGGYVGRHACGLPFREGPREMTPAEVICGVWLVLAAMRLLVSLLPPLPE